MLVWFSSLPESLISLSNVVAAQNTAKVK